MVPESVVIGVCLVAFGVLILGLCRAAGRADADMEVCMAQRDGDGTTNAPVEGPVAAPRRLGASSPSRGGPWIGRDQETRPRQARLKATQRRRRRPRVAVEGRVELVSDGRVLDARATLPEARARATEILADSTQGVTVVYLFDVRTGGCRGWMNRKDVA